MRFFKKSGASAQVIGRKELPKYFSNKELISDTNKLSKKIIKQLEMGDRAKSYFILANIVAFLKHESDIGDYKNHSDFFLFDEVWNYVMDRTDTHLDGKPETKRSDYIG